MNLQPLVELVVVPIVCFLLLMRWRDQVDVAHIPFADFVALLVILDVALWFEPHRFDALTGNAEALWPRCSGEFVFGVLAILELAGMRFLVSRLEASMAPIMVQQLDVGSRSHNAIARAGTVVARLNFNWRAYAYRWSASVAISAVFAAAHVFYFGWYIQFLKARFDGPLFSTTVELVFVAAAAFVLSFVWVTLLTAFGFYRFGTQLPRRTERGQFL